MNEPPSPELPPGRIAPYTRGETAMLWLCWLTPGIAIGLMLAAYLEWFFRLSGPEPVWVGIVFLAGIAVVLFGCAGFAAVILAGKSGRDRLARRAIKPALLFLLAQVFVAPLLGWLLLDVMIGP